MNKPKNIPDEIGFPDSSNADTEAFEPSVTNPRISLADLNLELTIKDFKEIDDALRQANENSDLGNIMSRDELEALLADDGDEADAPVSTAAVIVNLSPAGRLQLELQQAMLSDSRQIRIEITDNQYKELPGGALAVVIYHHPDQGPEKRLMLKKEGGEVIKLGGEHASHPYFQEMVNSRFEQIDSIETFEMLDGYLQSAFKK